MFVIIKDNNIIKKYNLNDDIFYNGISIYKKGDTHYIDLKNGLYFEDNSKSKELSLKSYSIKNDKFYYSIELYVYETDDGVDDYCLYKNTNCLIAYDSKANIICKDEYLKNYYLAIIDGTIKTNYSILVNNAQYDNSLLKDGDIIEYLGIKIFYYDDFLYINNFNVDINLDKYEGIDTLVRYKTTTKNDSYYIPDDIYDLKFKELAEFVEPKKQSNIDIIKTMLPNIVMCLSMGVMAYLNYVSNSNGNIVSYIVMPISMLLTSVLIPVIFLVINNYKYKKDYLNAKNEYLIYLDEYENELKEDILKYTNSLNSRFFNLFDSRNKMFYASSKTDEFMKLSIGKTIINNDICYKKTSDSQINERIKQIEKLSNYIDDVPLFVDILKNRIVTIVSKKIDREYFLYKFILEMSYKHHYDDINIAVYSKNDNIFDNIYNLPHLFVGKKRFTLNCEEQLQILDQTNLDKPLTLFLYDKCNYTFTNKNIYLIYFSSDVSDLLKNSTTVVHFLNNNGYIYSNKKKEFSYIQEDIHFNSYFAYLGKFKDLNSYTSNKTFSNIFTNDIKSYYLNNDHSLKASFAYSGNEIIGFDLHESKQGPHGLIGGSTGSGKSELIVSLLLSLCIRYSPEYLNIVLIDYKGGGIKESLSYNNVAIPHIVASISNLEDNALERFIIALANECKRRQNLFKELSKTSNTSIMNIDDYIDNNPLIKMSHLVIVVDEFAELKKNNLEQIKELISISRIGRSLGIHLILATQKPTGVIDDEIWSNSRFKIALKVFDEKDSSDIIKTKDAAYLTNPGSFLMLVDGGLVQGQALYSKTDYFGNDPYKVSILDNNLSINKTYKVSDKQVTTTASYYCKQIIDITKYMKLKPYNIDFMPPASTDRHVINKENSFVFGVIDDYLNNKNGILSYDIKDSLLIYSTRKYEINNILNTLNENKINSIVIGSKLYNGTHICDSVLYDNNEDLEYLFNYLLNNKNNNITLVIEDVSCLLSYDETYLDILCKLVKRKDSLNLSLVFISTSSQISFKLINMFNNKILININDNSDLSAFYGTRSIYKGNSYFYNDMPMPFIPVLIENYIVSKQIVNNIIKRIPDEIYPDKNEFGILIGYDEKSKEPVYCDKLNVVSLNQDLLNTYMRAYKDINACLYNHKLDFEDNSDILWLGSGIFNQRLFITGLREDIDDNQGILIRNSTRKLIRRVNNV